MNSILKQHLQNELTSNQTICLQQKYTDRKLIQYTPNIILQCVVFLSASSFPPYSTGYETDG